MNKAGSNAKISAIVTTRNRLNLLKRTIASIENQTYKNLEIIIVDDGSQDGTQDYCDGKGYKYIRINPEESKGGNHARNLGILASSGEFLAFCDDDDYWMPSKIEKQVQLILSKNVDFVHCGRRLEIIKGDNVVFLDTIPGSKSDGDISKSSFENIHCVTSTLLLRKSAVEQIGLFDEKLKAWQEHELIIRLSQLSETYSVKEALVVYRVDTSDSKRLTNKYYQWIESVKYIKEKHKNLISKLSFKEKMGFNHLIASDALGRAKASGLKFEWWYNRFKIHFYNLFKYV